MAGKQYKRKDTAERSLGDFASLASKKLTRLAQSKVPSDRLRVLNTIIFILLLSFIITHFIIYPDSLWSLSSLFILLIALFFSFLIGVFGYESYLNVLVKQTSDEINALKIGAITLLIAYPIAWIGLIFSIPLLIYFTLGFVALQTMVLLLYSVFSFIKLAENQQIQRGLSKDTISIFVLIIGILDIVVTIVSIIINVTQH